MLQGISMVGAVLTLIAYFAHLRGHMRHEGLWYRWLNTVGSSLMTYVAVSDRQWGFVLMEGTWAVISAWSLIAPRRTGH